VEFIVTGCEVAGMWQYVILMHGDTQVGGLLIHVYFCDLIFVYYYWLFELIQIICNHSVLSVVLVLLTVILS